MKILIVSWYFPPVNTIGAVRTGKFARFLIERGHEVGVVAGKNWGRPETMVLGVPLNRAAYAQTFDVNSLPRHIARLVNRHSIIKDGATTSDDTILSEENGDPSFLHRLSEAYVQLTNFPDNRIGWLPAAYRGCIRLCREWVPDLIFASGPPFTAHAVARLASRRLGVPWIAELRDRWADDPYEELPTWRIKADQWLERRILQTARALVTVSEPWAEFYRRKYGKPLAMILNGYDPADFDFPLSENLTTPSQPLVIGYTGGIYTGKRDPTPLFQAIRQLGADGAGIRVIFCGTEPEHVWPVAERAGVKYQVEVLPPVSYQQSLEFQRRSDVLLLMQWNDPREQGSCPGKLFEYIASLRPVLVLGLENGVPATIVRERKAGICANDPAEIATQLRAWLADKRELGRIPSLPPATRDGFSRTIQFERLERFFVEMTAIDINRQPKSRVRSDRFSETRSVHKTDHA